MNQSDVEKLNKYFARRAGKEACFANVIEEHDCLVIGFIGLDEPLFAVSFFYTKFVSGPFRFSNANFRCSLYEFDDGEIGLQVDDERAGFVLRAYGPIKLGDTREIVPSR
jgi:hypothetical protein